MTIFSDMVEDTIEVFMDDFSVVGKSFDRCLNHLDEVLKRCEDWNLVLSWGKCHFMMKEGILLGHRISEKRIEVDRSKHEVIQRLPPPISVKGVEVFLVMRASTKGLLRISQKLYILYASYLRRSVKFYLDESCLKAFGELKEKVVSAPIIISLH